MNRKSASTVSIVCHNALRLQMIMERNVPVSRTHKIQVIINRVNVMIVSNQMIIKIPVYANNLNAQLLIKLKHVIHMTLIVFKN